jgi:hypothetical protein
MLSLTLLFANAKVSISRMLGASLYSFSWYKHITLLLHYESNYGFKFLFYAQYNYNLLLFKSKLSLQFYVVFQKKHGLLQMSSNSNLHSFLIRMGGG